jgi:hypothetical protein
MDPTESKMNKQDVMSQLLNAEGFSAMAAAVLTEQDAARLARYERIIIKNLPKGFDKAATAALLKAAA